MPTLNRVLMDLRRNRERAQREVSRLDEAIAAIGKLIGRATARGSSSPRRGRRRLSAAARRRIAAAQRARWAKVKAAKKAA